MVGVRIFRARSGLFFRVFFIGNMRKFIELLSGFRELSGGKLLVEFRAFGGVFIFSLS